MRSYLGYFFASIIIGFLLFSLNTKRSLYYPPELGEFEIELKDLASELQNLIWVDARVESAFAEKHVPNAILLGPDSFESNLVNLLDQWTPGNRIIVYCDSKFCDSSHEIAERLRNEVGLDNVWVLHGGWKSWEEQ